MGSRGARTPYILNSVTHTEIHENFGGTRSGRHKVNHTYTEHKGKGHPVTCWHTGRKTAISSVCVRRAWVVNATLRPLYLQERNAWASGPFWKGTENPPPIGIRSKDRPASDKSLHLLRYIQNINSRKHSNYMFIFMFTRNEIHFILHAQI